MANGGAKFAKKKVPEPSKEELAALEQSSGSEDAAAKEAEQLGNNLTDEEIRQQAAGNEHRRNEKFRDHFEIVAVVALWLGAIALLAMSMTLCIHWLAPERWLWLSSHQLDKLQFLVTGGVVSGVVASHLKKRIG